MLQEEGPRPDETQVPVPSEQAETSDTQVQPPEFGAEGIPETGETLPAGETMDTPPNLDAGLEHQVEETLQIAERAPAVNLEKDANEKIQTTAFGRELLGGGGKLDVLRDKVDSQRPRGAWEKFTYFVGADKRAEGYKESRSTLKKAERSLGEWQRAETEQCRQGEMMGKLQELKLGEDSNAENYRTQIAQLEAEAQSLNEQIIGEGEGQEELIARIQEMEAQKLTAIDSLRRSERMSSLYEKRQIKLALTGHKDRKVLEEKTLPELAQLTSVTAEIPIEKGSGEIFETQEEIDDYAEKHEIISTLDKILTEPNSDEAKHLLKILAAKAEGAEDQAGNPEVHWIARTLSEGAEGLLRVPGLDARHQEEYLSKEVGKSIRIAAEALRTRLLIEQRGNDKIGEMSRDLKTYNPRIAFDVIDKKIAAERQEKASMIGIKKARKGYVIKQGWDNLIRENIKRGAKAAFGSEEEVQYDTRLRDILKDGSNMMAVVTQATGFLPAALNPTRLGTLTRASETVESMISWPLSKIFKRAVGIRKWRTSLSERRNNTSLRMADGVDAVTRVINDMDAIARRRNRRLGPRPTLRERAAASVNNVRNRVNQRRANNAGEANG